MRKKAIKQADKPISASTVNQSLAALQESSGYPIYLESLNNWLRNLEHMCAVGPINDVVKYRSQFELLDALINYTENGIPKTTITTEE